MVAYNDRDDLCNVINRERSQKSTLIEYFRMNNVDPFAISFLYREFLEYFRWDRMEKEWLRRKQRAQIGRMVRHKNFYVLCLVIYFWIRFDMFHLFCWYHN
jgi:hypothetical protein